MYFIPLDGLKIARRLLVVETLELKGGSVGLEGTAELQKSREGLGELREEVVVVVSVLLDPLLELLVLDKSVVSGEHHEGVGLVILVLLGAVPLADVPLLVNKELEKVVGEVGGGESPGAVETRVLGVAATEAVSTNQGNHLTVSESHAAKDLANVVLAKASVGKTALGGGLRLGTVDTAGLPLDGGAAELLNGSNTREGVEVTMGNPAVLVQNGLQEDTGAVKTVVGTVANLSLVLHGTLARTTVVGGLVKGTRGVPGKTDKGRTVGSLLGVTVVVLKSLGNGIVDLLVVLKGGSLGSHLGARWGTLVKVVTGSTNGGDNGSNGEGVGGSGLGRLLLGLLGLGRVEAGKDSSRGSGKRSLEGGLSGYGQSGGSS